MHVYYLITIWWIIMPVVVMYFKFLYYCIYYYYMYDDIILYSAVGYSIYYELLHGHTNSMYPQFLSFIGLLISAIFPTILNTFQYFSISTRISFIPNRTPTGPCMTKNQNIIILISLHLMLFSCDIDCLSNQWCSGAGTHGNAVPT